MYKAAPAPDRTKRKTGDDRVGRAVKRAAGAAGVAAVTPIGTTPDPATSFNSKVASMLLEASDILTTQRASPFRVNAYRRAAVVVQDLDTSLPKIFESYGLDGLESLPGIGRGIARAIAEIVVTGRWTQLERLRGQSDPLKLLASVPGIGPGFAQEIHDKLRVDTLEELENAAHDGRLRWVPGLGSRRVAAIKASLASILGRRRRRVASQAPSIAQVLRADEQYRQRAESGSLPRIAPKRFNPSHEAWLPVLHTDIDGWHFTALYSNTARAHELEKTHDWVVLYFENEANGVGQATVVTETVGSLKGRRVVRGRETESKRHYGLVPPRVRTGSVLD